MERDTICDKEEVAENGRGIEKLARTSAEYLGEGRCIAFGILLAVIESFGDPPDHVYIPAYIVLQERMLLHSCLAKSQLRVSLSSRKMTRKLTINIA